MLTSQHQIVKHSALHIANYILGVYGTRFSGLTNMKLQKLVYYVKAWSMVSGADIVADDFVAFKHGPVSNDLYSVLKRYGRDIVPHDASMPALDLTDKDALLVDMIVYTYGRLSAFTLSDITHNETPWKNTSQSSTIDLGAMKAFYAEQHFAVNFPPDADRSFAPLWTNSSASFALDMSEESRDRLRFYPSFAIYKAYVDKAMTTVGRTDLAKSLASLWNDLSHDAAN